MCVLLSVGTIGVVVVVFLLGALLFYGVEQQRTAARQSMIDDRRLLMTSYFLLPFQAPNAAVQGWIEITQVGLSYNITYRLDRYAQCNLTVVERVSNLPAFLVPLYAIAPGVPVPSTVAEASAALVDDATAQRLVVSLLAADSVTLACSGGLGVKPFALPLSP